MSPKKLVNRICLTCFAAALLLLALFAGLAPVQAQRAPAPSSAPVSAPAGVLALPPESRLAGALLTPTRAEPVVPSRPNDAFSGIWYDGAAQDVQCLAWGDYDGDGSLDLVVGNKGANRLFHNDGTGALTDVTPDAWKSLNDQTYSLAWGDFDGDGDLDLAVGNIGGNRLYRNDGNNVFTDATPGVWKSLSDQTYSLAWGDFNGDGRLDLAIGNNGPDRLFRNDGSGDFIDVTPASWATTTTSKTNSLAWGDYDGDGHLDLALGNEGVNQLFKNDGLGNFTEIAGAFGTELDITQSLAWGDMDGDGYPDLAVGNYPHFIPNTGGGFSVRGGVSLYHNNANGTFTLVSQLGGGYDSTQSVGWSDLDGDGDLDLVVGNAEYEYTNFMADQVRVDGGVFQYTNDGAGNFSGPTTIYAASTYRIQSVVTGDVDNDGDLDLAMGAEQYYYYTPGGGGAMVPGGVTLYRNNGQVAFKPAFERIIDKHVTSMAWGDYDGDGLLDLAVGSYGGVIMFPPPIDHSVAIYHNDGNGSFTDVTGGSMAQTVDYTQSLAWGDLDGDGDLDLAVGNHGHSRLYRNDGNGVFTDVTPASMAAANDDTKSLAWGDSDGDGDLDLAVGNNGTNGLYRNDGSGVFTYLPGALGTSSLDTRSLVWGDLDGDGNLDLVVGGVGAIRLYRNDGQNVFTDVTPASIAQNPDNTQAVALGDMDGDGDLDLAAGNFGIDRLYRNDGHWTFANIPGAFGVDVGRTNDLAWGDMEGDGDLDLAVGCDGPEKLFRNDGAGVFTKLTAPLGNNDDSTNSVAWGDFDKDGDPDLATGNSHNPDSLNPDIRVIRNLRYTQNTLLPASPPRIHALQPADLPAANFYAVTGYITQTSVPISFTLYNTQPGPVARVKALYSLNGGGAWREAVAAPGSQTDNLAATPGGGTYSFYWDTFASQFFGQSDNIVLHFEAYPQPAVSGVTGSYLYYNAAPDPSQGVKVSAATFPFRARGTQIRVLDDTGSPAPGAQVYRLPSAQGSGALPLASPDGTPYQTGADGYLQGRGVIGLGDSLYALFPISSTERYTLYATNGIPTTTTLQGDTVQQPGVQTLLVSKNHPLLAFNLDISLEWDARNDSDFMQNLATAIQRASDVLFDVSNGQVVLGKVRVFQDRQNWLSSDVIIYAQAGIRPRASMGGMVRALTDDVYKDGRPIHNAYGPGQIRLGPNWDPFGISLRELSVDWQRAFAHELSHYLLYLPDNYLGSDASGRPINTDCRGSFMTSTFDEDYSKFLIRPLWTGDCLETIAQNTTGRVDWETIRKFYPVLNAPTGTSPWQAVQPLEITNVDLVSPAVPASSLPPRIFEVRSAATGMLTPVPRAQVFLFQNNGTPGDLTDDQVLPLGAVVADGDRINVRGAHSGDRLCLFGPPVSGTTPGSTVSYAGCLDILGALDASIPVSPVNDWHPLIQMTTVTSVTLQVTVSLGLPTDPLNLQFYPAYGSASSSAASVWTSMHSLDPAGLVQTATLTLAAPTFEGWLRVWLPGATPVHEVLSQIFLSPPWGPNNSRGGMDANQRAWGANFRQLGAPVASGDGQVSIFNFTDIFSDTGTLSLHSLNTLPGVPSWLSQVGQGYRFLTQKRFSRAIAFDYLQREVPPGYEYTLTVYYSPDEGHSWQRLATQLDQQNNRATAVMPDNAANSQGLYSLFATVELPALSPGWNMFAYTVPQDRPVDLALASIAGKYTSIYSNAGDSWRLYAATVLPEFSSLVNDLATLQSGRAYWLYATEAVTPYLGVPSSQPAAPASLFQPPVTYYGWVRATESFTPTKDIPLQAWIDGNLCGESKLVDWQDGLAFKIQVMADDGNGCGGPGRIITFTVGGQTLPFNRPIWDNRQAHYLVLGPPANPLFLPVIQRQWSGLFP